jgi:hypothetical protein
MKTLVNEASGQANSGNTYLLDEETRYDEYLHMFLFEVKLVVEHI